MKPNDEIQRNDYWKIYSDIASNVKAEIMVGVDRYIYSPVYTSIHLEIESEVDSLLENYESK